ncbi:MAG: 5-formyltetrahydrofolate cyclo-ligase [Acholeplasmatales bacterium]|jgi:5-formyltetrahydrofolate cyclo-ligase|nr:5-formyltetrahydrofolate cyclo-ligase [Acholeplasmatales bacterium]
MLLQEHQIKSEIRRKMLSIRDNLNISIVNDCSNKLYEIITKEDYYINHQIIGIYYPIRNELNPRVLERDQNKTFLYPKIIGDEIKFFEAKDDFEENKYKIMEPKNSVESIPEIILVPCLALDDELNRIGYGKGFYDKYLSKHKKVISIGIIYSFQLVTNIKVFSSFDVKLDKRIIIDYDK